jgi:peptidoglycan/LPS O-acetylase OafA/YrhL
MTAVVMAASLSVATLMHNFVEAPASELGRRLTGRPSDQAPPCCLAKAALTVTCDTAIPCRSFTAVAIARDARPSAASMRISANAACCVRSGSSRAARPEPTLR